MPGGRTWETQNPQANAYRSGEIQEGIAPLGRLN